jgi:hypothetical protein
MKRKLVILGLILLPLLMHAQNINKCPDVDVLPKSLYDRFQQAQANLDGAEREIRRERGILEDLQKTYLGCEKQADVETMLKQAEGSLQIAEANRKSAAEAFAPIDAEVRHFIVDAHGRTVACRYCEPGYGEWGRVVMITFVVLEDKVKTIPTFYPLPEPVR